MTTESHAHGRDCVPTLYYLTAESDGRTALLSGPFVSRAEAEKYEGQARGFVAANRWSDLGPRQQFDAKVGVSSYKARNGARPARPLPPADYWRVTMTTAATGETAERCPRCAGTGEQFPTTPCELCGGTGEATAEAIAAEEKFLRDLSTPAED